ncbi:MAG: hypothetical protein QM778_21710 [Myxococcales bacterium]
MTRALPRLLWLALLALFCLSCTETDSVVAKTQVTLRIYNEDQTLLGEMTSVSITFSLHEAESWRAYPTKEFALEGLKWPVDIPILASKPDDEQREFEVVVRALKGDTVLTETRAVTHFVPNQRLLLEAWLYRCPGHDEPFVCADAACHGPECQVCGPRGTCTAVGFTDPSTLLSFNPDQIPDTKPVPGWVLDPDSGPVGGLDSGLDGSTPCAEDSLRCVQGSDTERQICHAGSWVATDACTGGQVCDSGSNPAGQCSDMPCSGDCGPCTENAMRCAGEASAEREVCQGGKFVAAQACPANELCDHAAATPGDCSPIVEGCAGQTPGSAVCLGSTRIVCGRDLVSISGTPKSCNAADYCAQGNDADCAVCVNGEHACDGMQLQICNDTHTGFTSVGNPCTAQAPCNKELGMCTSLICKANEWSCNGDTLRHCNALGTDYVTSDTKACGSHLCNANAQRCNVCEPGKIRCLEEGGKGRKQCNADGLGESDYMACANACLQGNCVACAPSGTRCDPSNSLQTRQTCSPGGAWGSNEDCFAKDKTCITSNSSSSCGGSCAAGSHECNSSGNSVKCQNDGTPDTPMTCTWPGFLCNKNTGVCDQNDADNLDHDSAAGGTAYPQSDSLSNGRIFAQPFRPDAEVKLEGMGMLVQAAPATNQGVIFSIWSDKVEGSNHVPDALITSSGIATVNGGSSALGTPDAKPVLHKDTTYWVAAQFGDPGIKFYRYTATTNATTGMGAYTYASTTFGVPPSTFPAGGTYQVSAEISVFAVVRKIWVP